MNIARAIQFLFPAAVPSVDFLVADMGEGPFIAEWRLPQAKPSMEVLTAAYTQAALADAKAEGLAWVAAYSKSKRALVAGTADDAEIAGWVNKLLVAQAIKAGTATPQEILVLQGEVEARQVSGETLDILVEKVLRNGAFFSKASALIDGIKRRAEDSVKAATTPEEVAAARKNAQAIAEAAVAELMGG